MRTTCWVGGSLSVLAGVFLACWPQPAPAYIGGPPATLGMMCNWSTHLISARVERVDREKGAIIFRKLVDYKGKWPSDYVRQVIPPGLPDRQRIFDWAEEGKVTLICALESYRWSHTYIDGLWYASNTGDWQWWNVSHGEPILLRTYSGKPARLVAAASAITAGKEVVVPCLTDGTTEELRRRKTKVQRLKCSLKRLDYNAKRDFVGFGGDDFNRIAGMAGFTHSSALNRVDPEAQIVSVVDFDGDGKLDLCLAGASKLLLLQNAGDYWTEFPLPFTGGCRAAVWADYNGDGRPDLLLATSSGPRLFTNLGHGQFRDDSHLLPKEAATHHLTAAAWIDYDGDGRPDILLATGYHGLRLYRNNVKGSAAHGIGDLSPFQLQPSPGTLMTGSFEDVSVQVGLGPDGIGGTLRGDTLAVCDVNGDGRPDFLFGAGTGLLVMNTGKRFVEAKGAGIVYKPGKVGPVFADFDNSGRPSLFVPQLDGRCKLFKNDGKGRFTDVTARTGDLARPMGMATSAAWGDVGNSGRLDLVVGCLRGPNRFFRNNGDGTFVDATEEIGLHQRIFNTQAVALVDLNNDGTLDMVFTNEGQESMVLLGNAERTIRRTPVTLQVKGALGVTGSSVRLLDRDGRCVGARFLDGGDGRGSQRPPLAHFGLAPGKYRAEVRFSSGFVQTKDITVGTKPLRTVVDDRMGTVD